LNFESSTFALTGLNTSLVPMYISERCVIISVSPVESRFEPYLSRWSRPWSVDALAGVFHFNSDRNLTGVCGRT